eukprot:scaffold49539_cov66-Phaeocystis_antarctica.AAC.4
MDDANVLTTLHRARGAGGSLVRCLHYTYSRRGLAHHALPVTAGLAADGLAAYKCRITPTRVGCSARLRRLPATAELTAYIAAPHLLNVGCAASLLRPACDGRARCSDACRITRLLT